MKTEEILIKAFNDVIDSLNESPAWTSSELVIGRIKPKFWPKGIIKIIIETDDDEIESRIDNYKDLDILKKIKQ